MLNFDDLCAIMRYLEKNKPNLHHPVKIADCYGEMLEDEEAKLDDVAASVLYLAQKDMLNVGQNLPHSKLTKANMLTLKAGRIRVYFITDKGFDFLAALNGGVTVDSIMKRENEKNMLAPELIDLFIAAGAKLLKIIK